MKLFVTMTLITLSLFTHAKRLQTYDQCGNPTCHVEDDTGIYSYEGFCHPKPIHEKYLCTTEAGDEIEIDFKKDEYLDIHASSDLIKYYDAYSTNSPHADYTKGKFSVFSKINTRLYVAVVEYKFAVYDQSVRGSRALPDTLEVIYNETPASIGRAPKHWEKTYKIQCQQVVVELDLLNPRRTCYSK